MVLDANVLLYARNASHARHTEARTFLEQVLLHGPRRVGLPWQSLTAFVRIATSPRVFPAPLSTAEASDQVEQWLAAPAAWVPVPGDGHGEVLLGLLRQRAREPTTCRCGTTRTCRASCGSLPGARPQQYDVLGGALGWVARRERFAAAIAEDLRGPG